jgi:hypothetical protein
MRLETNAWTMLFLQRQERKAKVRARRSGQYNSVVWGWK